MYTLSCDHVCICQERWQLPDLKQSVLVPCTYQSKLHEEKYKAIKDVDSGIKKLIAANKLGIPLNTLSTWFKNREKIEEAVLQNAVVSQHKRQRVGQFKDVEESLLRWFRDARKNNVHISGPLVCFKAQLFPECLQVDSFKCSVG